MRRFILFGTLLTVAVVSLGLWGQQKKDVLVVEPVVVSKEVNIPPDWLAEFTKNLVDMLTHSQDYEKVVGPTEKERPQDARTLRTEIVELKQGSRAKRYMISFGAGQEKLKAVVTLADATGKTIYQKDFASTTTMGLFGGKSGETPRKLAEKIVRALAQQRKFGGRPPTGTSTPDQRAGTSAQIAATSEAALLGVAGYATEAGFRVTSVRAGSPAAQAGINASDIISKIDGKEVHRSLDIESAISANASGTVRVTYMIKGAWLAEREVRVR
jgi:hypothetical protein